MKRPQNERRRMEAAERALATLAKREARLLKALEDTRRLASAVAALPPGAALPTIPHIGGNGDRRGSKNPRYLIGEREQPAPEVSGYIRGLAQKYGIPDSMLTPEVIRLLLAVERLGDALLERERYERPILAPVIIPSVDPCSQPWPPPSTPFTICQSDVA